MLYKPVVITDYPTAKSQITNGLDGAIVPMDEVETAEGMVDFMDDSDLRNKIVEHLKVSDFGNETEVAKIYNLMN